MSIVSEWKGGYGVNKDGFKTFTEYVKKDKKAHKRVPNRRLYYKKGFLPSTIEGLDITSDEVLNYISLRDFLQIVNGNLYRMKELKVSINRHSYELNDNKSAYTVRIYFRKKVGQVPTVMDAYVYDAKQGRCVERIDMDGDIINKESMFTMQDINNSYNRIAQVMEEDEEIRFACFEYVKYEGKMVLNHVFLLPPYPVGLGFGKATNEYLIETRRKQIWYYKRNRNSRFSRRFHRAFFNIKRWGLVSKGFTAKRAEIWLMNTSVDRKIMQGEKKSELKWAHKHGFTLRTVKNLGINENNYKNFISEKEYYRLVPINLKYQKWIGNLATIYYIFKPFKDYMAEFYYHIMPRDGEALIIPYANQKHSDDYYTQIRNLIEEKGSVTVVNINGARLVELRFADGQYYIGNKPVDYICIWKYITKPKREILLVETVAEEVASSSAKNYHRASKLFLYVYNRNGQGAKIGNALLKNYNTIGHYTAYDVDVNTGSYQDEGNKTIAIKQWSEIYELVVKMGKHVPQLEFFGIEFILHENSIQIKNMVNHPEYPITTPFSEQLMEFFKEKALEKNEFFESAGNVAERGGDTGKRRIRQHFAKLLYPKGLVPYLSVTWLRDMRQDFFSNKDCSFSKKMWAYRHGFLSYRLDQYGITKENWEEYIADFEYKWLRHINPYYKTWMEDKITIKYIANKYNQYFPEYYYHVICKNDEMNIIPLMDCPEGFGPQLSSIIDLVKEKKVMAFKPDEGSHGQGFFRCDYTDGEFFINYEKCTEEDIIARLSQNDSAYIVTEYIQMHPQLKEIYSGSVNTLRMIVFKRDGIHPEIGNSYMRIGTSKTGAIDNMAAGGMFAAIDINTGRYGGAKIFVDGDIRDCKRHPDTNVLIEGVIPNWELTKKLVLDIAAEIQELEFFGFDLAVTEDGIKIPEINRSPDYPKIEKYNRPTIDYLLYKLDRKKRQYGYHRKPNRTLIHLPKREKKIEY